MPMTESITAENPIPELVLVGKDEYLTYLPTTYEWTKGQAKFRLVIPAGQNTDLASAPWYAQLLGFKKEDERWHRASKVHDRLYERGKRGLPLPDGEYQYWNPITDKWENILNPYWKRKEADKLFLKIMLEDKFTPWRAKTAYKAVRAFGGIHSGNWFW